MNILALTHAHLTPDGLSPVSCERADSITGTWAKKLNWQVDVVHTKNTKWRGIWPDGKGLKINILTEEAPQGLTMSPAQLFSSAIKTKLARQQLGGIVSLTTERITKKIRAVFAEKGFALPHQVALAKKWGQYLSASTAVHAKKYDFIFVCVGYGDEYLLQTGLALSQVLHVPMVVDFRDLWSEHHDPKRISEKQKDQIRKLEKKLLVNTVLISAPQKHMVHLLRKWVHCPVYLLSHSAYVDANWGDGTVVNNEFAMLYAGKLYAGGPGLRMLLELIGKLSAAKLHMPLKCHFYVDETSALRKLVDEYGVAPYVLVNEWVSPSELWKKMRSAHLLIVPDPGVAENFPFLPTKTFQFALTGRQILCLSQYENVEMQEFLHKFDAGLDTTNIDEAVKWVTQLTFEKTQYESLPPLRNVVQREQVAEDFGREIEKIIAGKT